MNDELICNDYSLNLSASIAVPLNFSVYDVKDLKDRNRKFSKEIVLEGTSNNCAFFRSFYNFTVTDGAVNFDATQKTDAKLIKGGVEIFRGGILKLNKVTILDGAITFSAHIFSETVDYFLLLSNIRISELDWSAYDHDLTRTNIKNSWTAAVGSGYYYPLIERGNGRVGTIWNTTDIVPYIYAKEIVEKMYEYLGLTVNSAWLETDDMKNVLFGYGGGDYIDNSITALDASNRLVDLDNGDLTYEDVQTVFWGTEYVPLVGWQESLNANITTFGTFTLDNTNFPVVITSDLLTQYDDGTITVQKSGNYNFILDGQLSILIDTGVLNFDFSTNGFFRLHRNGQVIQNILLSGGTNNPQTQDINLNFNLYCQSGDELSFSLQTGGAGVSRALVTDVDVVTYSISTSNLLEINLVSIDESITDGGLVSLSKFIPDMLCSEFLVGFIRQFNLFTSDPDIDGIVDILPFTQYYTDTDDFDDISEDVDRSEEIEIKPIANTYGKTVSYNYKDNKDRDNIIYFESHGEKYGDYLYEQGSFFAKGNNKIDLPWSSIIPYQIDNGFLIPRYISEDNSGAIKGNKGAARLCFRNGLKAGNWTFRNTDDPTLWEALTTYPCIHHFNDWENPTFDLNFRLVVEVYYNASIVTTVNCFTEFYSVFMNELTNRAGQLVIPSVKWDNLTVKNKRFAKLQMLDGALYRLNKIIDFDYEVAPVTKIELVKVIDARKKATIQLIDKEIALRNPPDFVSPNGVGEDADVTNNGNNSISENSNLIRG